MFRSRSNMNEQMDDLAASGPLIDRTLQELDTINRWLGGDQVTMSGLKQLVPDGKQTAFHIADLGCGSGNMLKSMADWGRKQGLDLKLTGVDANPYIIDYARNKSRAYAEIEFMTANILEESFKEHKFDIITSTLFTHHFNDQQLERLLRDWKTQVRRGIVINDLHRHWLPYYSIKAITGVFSKSSMVRNDGPISVLRGFQRKDWKLLMDRCGINNYRLNWRWAFRWLVVIPVND